MTFLPIVVRELRVAARGRGLYHTRFWTAAGCIAVGVYFFLVFGRDTGLFGNGRSIFIVLSYVGFFYCIGMARNTVDCISQEKREGTLGLLFLTDLKGYDVALGKLFANSLNSFYGLVALVPVVCCAWVMGGVTLLEMSRVVLSLLNIFFFTHVAGLLVSTFSRDSRRATGGTSLLLFLYFLGIPGAVAFLRYKSYFGVAGILEVLDPGVSFRQASTAGTGYGNYWSSLLVVNLNAWLFLVLTSIRLPRCWQDKPRQTNSTWRTRFQQWCFGPPSVREALRQRLLNINPFLWLISRNRLGQITVWGVLGLIVCALVWGVCEIDLSESMPLFVLAIVLSHLALKLWIVSEACVHLEEQRHNGALEFLLSCTPLSVEEIVEGQWMALRRRFVGPVVAVLASSVILFFIALSPAMRNNSESISQFVAFAIGAEVMLVADFYAIGWVGMWRAMSAKKRRLAAGQTFARLLVLPWVILGLLGAMSQMRFFDSFGAALMFWFILGIAVDFSFAIFARQALFEQFRTLAAVQQQESLGLFGKLGRALGRTFR